VEHAFEGQSPMNMISFMDVIRNRVAHNEKSVLFVTYEPQNFIDMAHRFIMFFNGRIVFSGGLQEFLNSDNPYLLQYRKLSPDGPMVIL
jgi:ABC-type transporter Mla maintaining outer membrane lipid asymmetry ATPase subunit MlaF